MSSFITRHFGNLYIISYLYMCMIEFINCSICGNKYVRNRKHDTWCKNCIKKDPEEFRRVSRSVWYKKNMDYTKKLIHDVLGGKCVNCGFADSRALQIDHIHGNGTKEKGKKAGLMYYKDVLKHIEENNTKYQLLCANCNWIKRFENNEHR